MKKEKYSVLLVDNEPIIIQGLLHLIDWDAEKCEISGTAGNGAEALVQVKETEPDIVITDIRMPEMDGLLLCEKIREFNSSIQLIILTGFPDFEYAKRAIRYGVVDFILKPTTEDSLKEALKKAVEKLDRERSVPAEESGDHLAMKRQMLLSELLYSGGHSLLYYMNRLEEAGIAVRDYFVLSLRLPFSEDQQKMAEHRSNLEELFRKYAGDRELDFIQKSDNRSYLVAAGASKEELTDICEQVLREAEASEDYSLTMGMSRLVPDPTGLHRAVREADDALQFAMYDTQPPLVCYENLPVFSGDRESGLLKKLRLLEGAVENRSPEMVSRNLEELFEYMIAEAVPFSTIRQAVDLIWNFGIGILLSRNLLRTEFGDRQPDGETVTELKEKLGAFLSELLITLNRTEEREDSLLEEVRKYINAHFMENLSLDALAEMAHLSPSYFSRLFKREMGVNLSNYILRCRMEHATSLLLTTDKKIYEIAEEIGIDDPVYFSKLFKKVTGRKPREFRSQ